jgi:hypothetical protein
MTMLTICRARRSVAEEGGGKRDREERLRLRRDRGKAGRHAHLHGEEDQQELARCTA